MRIKKTNLRCNGGKIIIEELYNILTLKNGIFVPMQIDVVHISHFSKTKHDHFFYWLGLVEAIQSICSMGSIYTYMLYLSGVLL